MPEESHREEMNAAIRAQRERAAVPRSMLPPDDPPAAPEPAAGTEPADDAARTDDAAPAVEPGRNLLSRLFRR